MDMYKMHVDGKIKRLKKMLNVGQALTEKEYFDILGNKKFGVLKRLRLENYPIGKYTFLGHTYVYRTDI